MTRDALMTQLYTSKELKKAALYLTKDINSWQDILTDSILRVFDKYQLPELIDKNNSGTINGLVFVTMKNALIDSKRSAREYVELNQYNLADIHVESESLVITKQEKEESENLFGNVSSLGVRLMRHIDKIDSDKNSDRKLWESAQLTKLYIELGSFRKVEKATGICYQQVRNATQLFSSTMTDKRISVSVVQHGEQPRSGMELYRLEYPYMEGISKFNTTDFNVKKISYQYIVEQPTGSLDSDVYVFSRLQDVKLADKVLESGKKLVIDIDDYWNLHGDHPLKNTQQNIDYVSAITANLPKAHLVTCSTQTLADRCFESFGIKATVIKNTIPKDTAQFTNTTLNHSRVRFGYVGGVYHQKDLIQVKEGMKKLYADPRLSGKYQISLGGYNPNPDYFEYERTLTADYKGVHPDEEYLDYLRLQTNMYDHIGFNKAYRRMWAKPVTMYGEMYREIDVALIPLHSNPFNDCKSELKLIEAGFTGKAVIVSDVMPYAPHLEHEVNCLAVSPSRKDWYSNIRRMILDKDLREELAVNLNKYVTVNFNHKIESSILANALKQLTK